jgi:hypothetical protein
VLLLAHLELTVGALQIIPFGLVLLEANILSCLVQPILSLVALVNQLFDFILRLVYLILFFVEPSSELVN